MVLDKFANSVQFFCCHFYRYLIFFTSLFAFFMLVVIFVLFVNFEGSDRHVSLLFISTSKLLGSHLRFIRYIIKFDNTLLELIFDLFYFNSTNAGVIPPYNLFCV